jgi:hypothetical protein
MDGGDTERRPARRLVKLCIARAAVANCRCPPKSPRRCARCQRTEALSVMRAWFEDRLVAAHADGTSVRPEWYPTRSTACVSAPGYVERWDD